MCEYIHNLLHRTVKQMHAITSIGDQNQQDMAKEMSANAVMK
jgi:hypothetical protein